MASEGGGQMDSGTAVTEFIPGNVSFARVRGRYVAYFPDLPVLEAWGATPSEAMDALLHTLKDLEERIKAQIVLEQQTAPPSPSPTAPAVWVDPPFPPGNPPWPP